MYLIISRKDSIIKIVSKLAMSGFALSSQVLKCRRALKTGPTVQLKKQQEEQS